MSEKFKKNHPDYCSKYDFEPKRFIRVIHLDEFENNNEKILTVMLCAVSLIILIISLILYKRSG